MQKPKPTGWLYIGLLIATWITLITTFFFSGIANVDVTFLKWGLYVNTIGNVSDAFYIEITPASWTFSIWGFIYTYQAIWMIYATSIVFRKADDGTRLFNIAPFIHWSIFIVYIVNNMANIAWMFLFDRKEIVAAFIVISIIGLTTYVTGALSVWGIYKYNDVLVEHGFRIEARLVLGMVTNAFAMYGAWVSVATLLNMAIILVYAMGVPQPSSSAVSLSFLMVQIMVWVLLDFHFLEKYTRFIFAPYAVLIIALSGSISKNFNATSPNSVFTVALLCVVLVLTGVKIALVIYREWKRPAFQERINEKVAPL